MGLSGRQSIYEMAPRSGSRTIAQIAPPNPQNLGPDVRSAGAFVSDRNARQIRKGRPEGRTSIAKPGIGHKLGTAAERAANSALTR